MQAPRLFLRMVLSSLSLALCGQAQTAADLPAPARIIALYDSVPPGSENWNWQEHTFVTLFGNTVTRNVVKPTLEYYPADPAKSVGMAVIVTPGGGFSDLMIKAEGIRTVKALNELGIDAFILKYRLIYIDPAVPLPRPGTTVQRRPLLDENGVILVGPQKGQNIYEIDEMDGRRAVEWLRAHAGEFRVAPGKIGMIGFSAGAFVVLDLAVGPPAGRPDFVASIYGPDTRGKPVPADAPPLFIAVAADDEWSSPLSLALFKRWSDAKRPAEIHVFQTGGHGFVTEGGGSDFYVDRLAEWMRTNHWLPSGPHGNRALFR